MSGRSLTGTWGGRTSTGDRKSTRLNSSHLGISYAVFCLEKKIPHEDLCSGSLEALDDRGTDPLQSPGHDRGAALEIQLVHSFTAPVMPDTEYSTKKE